MANKKLAAPAALTESLGATLPAVIQDERSLKQTVSAEIAAAEAQFGDGLEFDENRLTMVANGTVIRVALEYSIGGAALIRIKAHKGHGEFLPWLQANCDFSADTAQKMMTVARALLLPNGQPRPLLTAVSRARGGGVGKALELANLSREELNALDSGEEVRGLTIDSIDLMSTRELREELSGRNKLIDQKDATIAERVSELEAADKEIRRLKRGGKEVEQSNFAEILDDCTTAFDEQFKVAEKMICNIADTMAVLDETVVPAHMQDISKRSLVMGSHARIVQLGEIVARLIDRHEITFSRFHSDSKFLLPDADGAMQ